MSWTHSSKAVALGVLLAVALAAVGTVGAVQISGFDDAPESGEVGETVTVEAELTELYGDNVPDDEWVLTGETELENPDWTVIVRDAGGDEAVRQDVGQDTFEQDVDRDSNHVTVDVTITGEVPELDSFDYEDQSVEEILTMELSQLTADGDTSRLADGEHHIHRYTSDSQDARNAIESAEAAAEESDSDSARDRIQDAITFYNNGEFESAVSAAEDAESTAEGEAQTQQMLLFGGAAIVVVALLVGGIYYWRQSREDRSKLQ